MENSYQPSSFDTIATPENNGERNIPQIPITLDPMWCIKTGWKLVIGNFGKCFMIITLPLIINNIASMVIQGIGNATMGVTTKSQQIGNMVYTTTTTNFGASLFMQLIAIFVSLWITAGVIKATLKFIDGEEVSFSDVFTQLSKVGKIFVAGFFFYIAVSIGMLLLIVPGIYIACRYGYFMHAIVDKNLGIFESFSYSSNLTKSSKLNVFILALLAILVTLAGAICLLVGLLWAIPVVSLGYTLAYCYMHHGEQALART